MIWLWISLASLFIFGFFVGRSYERDQMEERMKGQLREEQILGSLGPIAGALLTGQITRDEASNAVRDAERVTPGCVKRWNGMDEETRTKLGQGMMEVWSDPKFRERQDELLAALMKGAQG